MPYPDVNDVPIIRVAGCMRVEKGSKFRPPLLHDVSSTPGNDLCLKSSMSAPCEVVGYRMSHESAGFSTQNNCRSARTSEQVPVPTSARVVVHHRLAARYPSKYDCIVQQVRRLDFRNRVECLGALTAGNSHALHSQQYQGRMHGRLSTTIFL